jgi:hypothetical protein
MTRLKSTLVFCLSVCCICIFASTIAADSPVQINVTANVVREDSTIMVTARVRPDARNRTLALSAESDAYLRRSVVQLEGANDAEIHQFVLKSLPAGQYVISAELRGTSNLLAVAQRELTVVGVH